MRRSGGARGEGDHIAVRVCVLKLYACVPSVSSLVPHCACALRTCAAPTCRRIGLSAMHPSKPTRPYSAPSPGSKAIGVGASVSAAPSASAFLHRDVFAPPPSPRPPPAAVHDDEWEDIGEEASDEHSAAVEHAADVAAAEAAAAAAALSPDAPHTPLRRRRKHSSSVLPSASKLDRWNTKLGQYRECT